MLLCISEPIVRWCPVKDETGNVKVVKVPVKDSNSSSPHVKNVKHTSFQDIDGELEIPANSKKNNDLKVKKSIHIHKLKSEDISQLLEKDNDSEDDGSLSDLMEDDDDDDDDDQQPISKIASSKHSKHDSKMNGEHLALPRNKFDSTGKENRNESLRQKHLKKAASDKKTSNKVALSPTKTFNANKSLKSLKNVPSSPGISVLKDISSSPKTKALKSVSSSPRTEATQEKKLKSLKEKMFLSESDFTSENTPETNNIISVNKKSVKKKLLYEDSCFDIGNFSDSSSIISPSKHKKVQEVEPDVKNKAIKLRDLVSIHTALRN